MRTVELDHRRFFAVASLLSALFNAGARAGSARRVLRDRRGDRVRALQGAGDRLTAAIVIEEYSESWPRRSTFWAGPRVSQRHGAVECRRIRLRRLAIGHEISMPLELE